jgi:hypothetical protein
MSKTDELVLVFTGSVVEIEYVRGELEAGGIVPIVKDGFSQGLKAGFVADTTAAIDLFVLAGDAEKALEILNDLNITE